VPEIPAVPLTIEGSYVLHEMFRFDRSAWRSLDNWHRERIFEEAIASAHPMEEAKSDGHPAQSAFYSLIGHKGDLMVVHFRKSLDDLHRAELSIRRLEIAAYLQPVHSYLSVVELGLYDSSVKTFKQLAEEGIEPHTPQWAARIKEVLDRQSAAMAPRLYPEIPTSRYICFYPMDRRRGESKNWYQVPMIERQRMMEEHGMVGRRYAGSVKQIITGSIGFDDWEWGVDLFADDPLVFKRLIYEMRFDEVSAVYALFGAFYVGLKVSIADIGGLLSGESR
jgi:hydrogen peroxide-dependent heme synthase